MLQVGRAKKRSGSPIVGDFELNFILPQNWGQGSLESQPIKIDRVVGLNSDYLLRGSEPRLFEEVGDIAALLSFIEQ